MAAERRGILSSVILGAERRPWYGAVKSMIVMVESDIFAGDYAALECFLFCSMYNLAAAPQLCFTVNPAEKAGGQPVFCLAWPVCLGERLAV